MIRESNVALPISEKLRVDGWDVRHEVRLDRLLRETHELGDARADIAATRGQRLMVVETKLGIGLEVFVQAKRWLPFVDEAWIGIPSGPFTDVRREAYDLCRRHYGFGVYEVDVGTGVVIERVQPDRHRRHDDALLVSLDEGQKIHGVPGTNRGGYFTPEKRTFEALAKLVADNPRKYKIDEAVKLIQHHYRTNVIAEEVLSKSIRKGNVPGVAFGWRQNLEPVEVDPVESMT